MNLFDTRSMSQNQRFNRMILIGLIAAIILGFAYGLVSDLAGGWELHVLYLLIGYLIGNFVRRVGRGVQKRFQILAAVLTILVILIGDMVYPMLVNGLPFSFILSITLRNYFSGISGLLSLIFRVSAVVVAYTNAT